MTQGALDRLADLAGIEPGFHDLFGTDRHTTAEAKRALLAATGIAAASDAEAEESLRALLRDKAQRLVEPTIVLPSGAGEATIALRLPEGVSEGPLRWTIDREDGETNSGEAALAHCPSAGIEQLGEARCERKDLRLPLALPDGYHRLSVTLGSAGDSPAGEARSHLIVAPGRCFDAIPDGAWAIATQLYALRSRHDWGVGDFSVLGRLAAGATRLGAQAVGVNPLHARYPADPAHCSPYSPSSRTFLDVLHIDVEAVPELESCAEAKALIAEPDFRKRLAAVRSAALVDYPAVAALKLSVLRLLWNHFRVMHHNRPTAPGAAFAAFKRDRGEALLRHACFDALHEHFFGADPGRWDWRGWPEDFRRPDNPAVTAFAKDNADRIGFYVYLQWLSDLQLAGAAARGREAGLGIGLYCDLAVAVNPAGADTWSRPTAFAHGVSVGSPPDMFNPDGQNWGLAPFNPVGLRETGYAGFVANLRANMRHAGAVRIDHVMALQRLYWIPEGRSGTDGAYVRYPLDDLLRIIALESRRNECIVVGEDLGTVPEGFRPRLAEAGILSCRVLLFEREKDGAFRPPAAYPRDALVSASTHDLPTLAGFWSGNDIAWRRRRGLLADEDALAAAEAARAADRRQLLQALAEAGLLPLETSVDAPPATLTPALNCALHAFLGRTPGRIVMVQIEDMLRLLEQANLPGTTDEHPNWRRRLDLTIDALLRSPEIAELASALRAARLRPDA